MRPIPPSSQPRWPQMHRFNSRPFSEFSSRRSRHSATRSMIPTDWLRISRARISTYPRDSAYRRRRRRVRGARFFDRAPPAIGPATRDHAQVFEIEDEPNRVGRRKLLHRPYPNDPIERRSVRPARCPETPSRSSPIPHEDRPRPDWRSGPSLTARTSPSPPGIPR